jgi:uncharacterized protein with HEPN domain
MSSRSWQQRIEDILNSIAAIQSRTSDMNFTEFEKNETVIKAVLFDFIIIGEATRNIPLEIQAMAPDIPWRLMGDMRNVMTHEYFQVDLQIVWDGIQDDLPDVVEPLSRLLP